MLPASEASDILLKTTCMGKCQYSCQELITPIRKTGTEQDYIKACIDASTAVVQGLAYAAAMQGQHFSAYVQNLKGGRNQNVLCFSCGQQGYMS